MPTSTNNGDVLQRIRSDPSDLLVFLFSAGTEKFELLALSCTFRIKMIWVRLRFVITAFPVGPLSSYLGKLSLLSLRGRYNEYRPVWLGLSLKTGRIHLCRVAGNTV